MKQRWRVWCAGSLNPGCGWRGYRMVRTKEAATRKPCPQCGGAVSAVPVGSGRPQSGRRMVYSVTVEPDDRFVHPTAPPVRTTIEADDKDAALDRAEAAYRGMYPNAGKLRIQVVRLRAPLPGQDANTSRRGRRD